MAFIYKHKMVNESHFDFSKELMSIDSEEEAFNKVDKRDVFDRYIKDFDSCNIGDVIYYDETNGINKSIGDPFAICYDKKLTNNFLYIRKYISSGNRFDADHAAKKISIQYNKKFKLPTEEELSTIFEFMLDNPDLIDQFLPNYKKVESFIKYGYAVWSKDYSPYGAISKTIGGVTDKFNQGFMTNDIFLVFNPYDNINENMFTSSLISFDDDDRFDKSNTVDVSNTKGEDRVTKNTMATVDMNQVMSKFTGLSHLPYVIEDSIQVVEEINNYDRKCLYVITDPNAKYNEQQGISLYLDVILELDKLLTGFGWETITYASQNAIESKEKIVKEFGLPIDKKCSAYISPDQGVIGLFFERQYFKFFPSGKVIYSDCLQIPEQDSKQTTKFRQSLSTICKETKAKRYIKDIIIKETPEGRPYIDLQVFGNAKAPAYMALIVMGLLKNQDNISCTYESPIVNDTLAMCHCEKDDDERIVECLYNEKKKILCLYTYRYINPSQLLYILRICQAK